MEKRRRTGVYALIALIAVLLIAWLTVNQMKKNHLITQLGHRGTFTQNGRHHDISIRVNAARKLLEMEKLEDSLAGLPVYKRSYTAQALGEIRDDALADEAIRILGVILRDQETKPQEWAGRAIIKHGKRAIPTLMAALSAGGGTTDNAILALDAMGKDAAPRLRFLLQDRGPYAAAAQALAEIGGIGTKALVKGAYCADNKLRIQSIANLAGAKRPDAHEVALKAALDNLSATDKLAQIDDAIPALGVLADKRATPALLPFLLKDKKTATATALGLIGDPRAVEGLLAQIPAGDPGYRNAAVLALSRIGTPAVPALVRELKSSQVVMRQSAAQALIGTKAASANTALITALSDSDAGVRAPAARALGWEGNVGVVDALVKTLNDKDYRVVDKAVESLGDIGTTAIPKLLSFLANPNVTIVAHYQISRAFEVMGLEAAPQLRLALTSANPEVQKWCASALGNMGDQLAVNDLKKLGKAATGDVRWVVQEQLRVLTGSTKLN